MGGQKSAVYGTGEKKTAIAPCWCEVDHPVYKSLVPRRSGSASWLARLVHRRYVSGAATRLRTLPGLDQE
jgi:hypothetical protein